MPRTPSTEGDLGPSRRERMHRQVLQEIREAARAELTTHGPTGVTMRAVARAIDMVPSGLYRYVADHDELIGLLATDAYESLLGDLRAARATAEAGDHAGEWYACALALRLWAIDNPSEQALLSSPGLLSPPPAAAARAAREVVLFQTRICDDAIRARQIGLDEARMPCAGVFVAEEGVSGEARAMTEGALIALEGFIRREAQQGFSGLAVDPDDYYGQFVVSVMRQMGFCERHVLTMVAADS